MDILGKIIREPLLHFLAVGICVFLLFNLMNKSATEKPSRIVISSGQVALLAANFSRARQRPPSEKEMQRLIDTYLHDEVYYREALALGLDRDDSVIRRRMRQKLSFILEDTAALLDPDDEELTIYMGAHAEQFRIQSAVSFRQVYLSADARSDINADAKQVLSRLRAGENPLSLGDRIMLKDTYILASRDDIKRRFGEGFAQQLLALAPGDWAGPLKSGFGGHLVLITEIRPSRMPPLSEVKEKVKSEWLHSRKAELKQDTFRKLLESYEVVIQEPEEFSDAASSNSVPIGDANADVPLEKEPR